MSLFAYWVLDADSQIRCNNVQTEVRKYATLSVLGQYCYREKIIEENQESLHFCILKGCCPRCLSKKIEYREFLTNQRFGFKCQKCGWQGEFSVEELMQFARRWL